MGPGKAPSSSLPNVLVIGDSVSIGYVGGVEEILKPVAQVQHGPWDVSDGGAGDTATGVACLDRWLVTQASIYSEGQTGWRAKGNALRFLTDRPIHKRIVSAGTRNS